MNDVLAGLTVALFVAATLVMSAYGLHLYCLMYLFRRRHEAVRQRQREVVKRFAARPDDDWPVVTTQLPLFNERDVARRVIEAAASMDYPPGRHEIQVLDDSTDSTSVIVDETAANLVRQGFDVKVLRRADRSGYKAGALQFGLQQARGELLAIFDADFVPPREFLRRAVPLLIEAPDLACLQGRWSHLNERESWITRAQALGIDGHFAVEQGARAWNSLLMNFNGTAGVWRKAAIADPAVGGWSGDTLTEDIDLSYRAQLAGWRIEYCLDLACPAELPNSIAAFKTQQRRWATGSMQVARKLLPRIWRSRGLNWAQKLEATLHLTHYSVALWMLILAVLARPALLLSLGDNALAQSWLWLAWPGIVFSALAPSALYAYARRVLGGGFSGLSNVPAMVVLGLGICLNNAVAAIAGLCVRGGEFVRTPKSGSGGGSRRQSSYQPLRDSLWIFEMALGVYMLSTFVTCLTHAATVLSIFLLLYAVGFLAVGWQCRPQRLRGSAQRESSNVAESVGAAS